MEESYNTIISISSFHFWPTFYLCKCYNFMTHYFYFKFQIFKEILMWESLYVSPYIYYICWYLILCVDSKLHLNYFLPMSEEFLYLILSKKLLFILGKICWKKHFWNFLWINLYFNFIFDRYFLWGYCRFFFFLSDL